MKIDPEIVDRLIPEGFPPDRFVAAAVRQAGEALIIESQVRLRSYLWASALVQAAFESSIPPPPGLSHVSAGFVGIDEEAKLPLAVQQSMAEGISFGLFALARRTVAERAVAILEVGDHAFPITVVSGRVEHHGCPPHPRNGSSSCWVRSNGRQGSGLGILTCRHVVQGLSIGASVGLQPSKDHARPKRASVGDVDESTIDAAILSIDRSDWPERLSTLPVQSPTAPGHPVSFHDRRGRTKQGTVLRVFHYSPYTGNLLGQRIIADCHGTNGDSGSLLLERRPRPTRGVGLYIGVIPDGSGGKDGIFQDLGQVGAQFGVSFYR